MPAFVRALLLLLTSHVRQWPLRTLLTIVGVALGVSASVAVRTANVDVLRSFEQTVMTVGGPTTLEVSGGETGLDEQVMTRVRTVAGVTSASPVILQTAVRMRGEQADQAVQVVGLDLLAEINTRGFRMSQPATESQLMSMIQPEAVFLGAKLAREWNLSVEDQVDLLMGPRRLTCRVAGILRHESDRTSSWERMAVMDIAAAQITFGMVGKVDRIDIVTDEKKAVEEVAQALRTVLPPH
ncbi:MAG TPA: ABC transporter permease, partial [Nitrospira sp.]